MGVSDRYYMNGTEESVNYSGRRFSAVHLMMIVNVVVWILWQFANGNESLKRFVWENFTVSAAGVIDAYRIHTLFTAAISHSDLQHIFFNLLFFWAIGEDVERIYGYRNFLALYAFTGMAASVAHIGMGLATGMAFPALGASGSVMGIAVVAAIFDPNRPIMLWFVSIPLKWLVTGYILIDIFAMTGGGGGPVANAGHLGGAAAGALFYKLDLRLFSSPGRAFVGWWNRISTLFRRKPRLRVVRPIPEELPAEPVAKAERALHVGASARASGGRVDPATSRKVDELLSKISREGIGALTDDERAFLKESSEKYKTR